LGLKPVAVVQYTFTHNTQDNTMKQNSQNGTEKTIRIDKYNNKNTKLNRSI